MEQRAIPGTGLAISCLGLGGWLTIGDRLAEADSLRLLQVAVDGGVNFLDLADVYGNGGAERVVGKFVRAVGRDQLVISSKVFWPTSDRKEDRGLSRQHIHAAIDRTLARLGIECLDLYFCHREDPSVPLAETVQAMGDLVRAGKITAWGTSCWQAPTLVQAHRLAAELGVVPPRVEQPQYNLLERAIEARVLPACRELGMSVVAFSPLAGGVLTGKYVHGRPAGSRGASTRWIDSYVGAPQQRAVAGFIAACRERGLEPAVVALAWLLHQPGLGAAIVGATNEAQLRSNLAAASFQFGAEGSAWVEAWFAAGRRSWWRRVLRRLWRGARS